MLLRGTDETWSELFNDKSVDGMMGTCVLLADDGVVGLERFKDTMTERGLDDVDG